MCICIYIYIYIYTYIQGGELRARPWPRRQGITTADTDTDARTDGEDADGQQDGKRTLGECCYRC